MSRLFRKVSWPHNIERFDRLRTMANSQHLKLTVKNGGSRTAPMFMFYLKSGDGRSIAFSHILDEIETRLLAQGGAK